MSEDSITPIREPTAHSLPERGSRWRHPFIGGTWCVESVGRTWVTLRSETPLHQF
jgi:hypothetical protein